MKSWLMDLAFLVVGACLIPVSLWRWLRKGRFPGNPWQRILGLVPATSRLRPVVWIHGVSVGEVNQIESLVAELARLRPDAEFVISTTTATGMELARKKYPGLAKFWFPMDFSWAVANALRRIHPSLIVLVELEVWPNLLSAANRRGVPVAVINGRLSDRSFGRYHRFRRFVSGMFGRIDLVVTQDREYARRFEALGVPPGRIEIAGSIKYDNALRQAAGIHASDGDRLDSIRRWMNCGPGDGVLVAGSTQAPEEEMILRVWKKLADRGTDRKLVIVPRHPHRAQEIAAILEREHSDVTLFRRSRASRETAVKNRRALYLVDTIGELGMFWALADIAFVGGSFGSRGGQNMLEPAAAGCAVCFGPNTSNFREIVADMKRAGAGVEAANEEELEEFVRRAASDPEFREAMERRGKEFVRDHSGATARTVAALSRLIPDLSCASRRSETRAA